MDSVQELIKLAEQQGFNVSQTRGSGHYLFVSPSGQTAIIGKSPKTQGKTWMNYVKHLERIGLVIPGRGKPQAAPRQEEASAPVVVQIVSPQPVKNECLKCTKGFVPTHPDDDHCMSCLEEATQPAQPATSPSGEVLETCTICGRSITKQNFPRHLRTKRCQAIRDANNHAAQLKMRGMSPLLVVRDEILDWAAKQPQPQPTTRENKMNQLVAVLFPDGRTPLDPDIMRIMATWITHTETLLHEMEYKAGAPRG